MRRGLVCWAAAWLCACGEPATERPSPINLTGDEIGYFCHMTVVEHNGPKAQIFVAGRATPLWFTSVRDALVFTRLPDEPRQVHAIYVNDMGRADWDQPQADTWIDATTAHYVVGSDRRGGMGAPELVPFAERAAAVEFSGRHGGEIVEYAAIADHMIFVDSTDPTRAR